MSERRAGRFGDAPKVVLVVLDDPQHRADFRQYFAEAPYHLVFARDGEDGFDCFEECRPHLVLVHANVTRIDGTILCQLIRQQPRGQDVPVVLFSEDLDDGPATQARLAAVRADAYLTYPSDPDAVADCVVPLLEHGRRSSRSTDLSPPTPSIQALDAAARSAELAFGSVLEDFVDHSDEAGGVAEAFAHEQEGGEGRHRGKDMDTVVSFKNPFYEGSEPSPLELAPLPAIVEASPSGAATIQPPLGHDEQPTPVGPEQGARLPAVRVTSGFGSDQPVTEQAESPSGALPAVPQAAVVEASEARALGIRDVPTESAPQPRRDPLEEPEISRTGRAVRPNRDVPPGNSSLIREVPREVTPSDENRASQVGRRGPGQRRGLDESQLGKRLTKRVRKMHRLLDEVDYYQLLGVEQASSQDDLRKSYFDLSLEFHPDRFFLLHSGELKEQIYDIFRRIGEAYRVLADEDKRRAYDEARSIKSTKRAAPDLRESSTATLGARGVDVGESLGAVAHTDPGTRFIEQANAAFARGDFNAARMHLVFAEAHELDNPSIRAALGHVIERCFARS